jgi:hypothetical protein
MAAIEVASKPEAYGRQGRPSSDNAAFSAEEPKAPAQPKR